MSSSKLSQTKNDLPYEVDLTLVMYQKPQKIKRRFKGANNLSWQPQLKQDVSCSGCSKSYNEHLRFSSLLYPNSQLVLINSSCPFSSIK